MEKLDFIDLRAEASENVKDIFNFLHNKLSKLHRLGYDDEIASLISSMNPNALVCTGQNEVEQQNIMFGLGRESGRYSKVYFFEVAGYTAFFLGTSDKEVARRTMNGYLGL